MGVNLGKRYRHYIDTETTGLDPTRHELLEVAVVSEEVSPLNPMEPGMVSLWVRKITPEHVENAEPKALEVNGYTPEGWVDAVPFADVARELAGRLQDGVIVGHNVKFDLDFLDAAFKRAGVEAKLPYHTVDTVALAYTKWAMDGELERVSLDPIRDFLGMSKAKNHSALKDALDCRSVFYKCIEPNGWAMAKRLVSHCVYKVKRALVFYWILWT